MLFPSYLCCSCGPAHDPIEGLVTDSISRRVKVAFAGLTAAFSCAHLHSHPATGCITQRLLPLPRTHPFPPVFTDPSFLTTFVQATKVPTLLKAVIFVLCCRIGHRPLILKAGNNLILPYIPQACSFWPLTHGTYHFKLVSNCK